MESEFYRDLLSEDGIDILVPESDDKEVIHQGIYDELIHGVIKDSSREAYKRIITHMEQKGAEGVILGCTEIPLLIKPKDLNIPIF